MAKAVVQKEKPIRRKKPQGVFIWVAAVGLSLGLFAHSELRMLSLGKDALAQRRSIVVPLRGPLRPIAEVSSAASEDRGTDASLDPRRNCVEQLIQSILEPSPYAAIQVMNLEIEPGYLKDTYRFEGSDVAGNDYSGQGYVTFSEKAQGDGGMLECSQSSMTGPWVVRSLRFSLWHEGSPVWEDRDPIG